ncbi:MAG: aminodeoxychorismate lyase [Betaproteobacteria bacterium]|nr:aminodeoxychorismate lyase [Betaproteobacteria bacterium]
MNLVNGVESDAISARDRGLAYGDGVFRTFRLRGGKPVLWWRQYAKLGADCKALRISCPASDVFERDLAVIAGRHSDCVVKIIVTRGSSERGYAISAESAPVRVVSASPSPEYPRHYYERGVRVHLCRNRLAAQPALAGIKHLNRLENVLARSEWSDPEIAEGLMCDAEDNVICGTMTNLFLARGGVLMTPDLARCGVAGVQRERVIELALINNIPARISSVSIDNLLAADELFLVNSVIGVWQIAALDRKTWNAGPLTAQIRRWLDHAQDR